MMKFTSYLYSKIVPPNKAISSSYSIENKYYIQVTEYPKQEIVLIVFLMDTSLT